MLTMKMGAIKWVSLIACIIIFLSAVNHGLQRWVILPSFIELERQQAQAELSRVMDAIEREAEHIDLLLNDWSNWDDNYQFVQDGNQPFIDSNLVWETMAGTSAIHLMYFYNVQHQLVWGEVFDSDEGLLDSQEFSFSVKTNHENLLHHASVTSSISGIIATSLGPILIASRPVLTSQRSGPIMGTMLMGRFLDAFFLQNLAAQTRVQFNAYQWIGLTEKDRKELAVERLLAGEGVITEVDEEQLKIEGIIKGVDGQPVLLVRAVMHRAIMNQGLKVATLVSVAVLVSLALLGLILLLVARNYMLAMRTSNTRINKLVRLRTQELNEATLKAEQAVLTAKAANESKSVFLANMSHEIRTPMNAVINLSYLCLQKDITGKQRGYIEKVNKSANSLLRIINDILDFSKVEAGQMQVEQCDFSLDDIFSNLAVLDILNSKDKDVQLIFNLHPNTPIHVRGDVLRINQILLNFLSNAIKFTIDGYITVSIEMIKKQQDKLILQFRVEDTGIGMTQTVADKMSQPYTQADTSTTRRYGGTGLGLVISKQLIELMGGSFKFLSEEGKGTQAIFTLPLTLAQNEQAAVPSPLKILLISKDQTTGQTMHHTLTAFNMQVKTQSTIPSSAPTIQEFDVVLWDDSIALKDLGNYFSAQQQAANDIPVSVFLCNQEQLPEPLNIFPVRCLVKPLYFSSFMACISSESVNQAVTSSKPNELINLSENLYQQVGMQRILVADDNELNQDIIVDLLQDCGSQVVVANHGQEALSLLEQQQFDVILMDIQMPVMDGMEATRQIRLRSKWDKIPIIALTASATKAEKTKGLASGMNEYLTKPIIPQELFTALARWCVPKSAQENITVKIDAPVAEVSQAKSEFMEGAASSVGQSIVLDVAAGLKTCNGKHTLYEKLLDKFTIKFSHIDGDIESALKNEEAARARSLAHNLTGVAANIGALALSQCARQLDKTLATQADVLPVSHLQILSEQLQQVLQAIKQYRQTNS